jgi:hypothetical protein
MVVEGIARAINRHEYFRVARRLEHYRFLASGLYRLDASNQQRWPRRSGGLGRRPGIDHPLANELSHRWPEHFNRVLPTAPSIGVQPVERSAGGLSMLPEVIPPEACYLGWQESLTHLAYLVEPEISE